MEHEYYAVVAGVFEPGEEGNLIIPLYTQFFYSEEEAKKFHQKLREYPWISGFEDEELWKNSVDQLKETMGIDSLISRGWFSFKDAESMMDILAMDK